MEVVETRSRGLGLMETVEKVCLLSDSLLRLGSGGSSICSNGTFWSRFRDDEDPLTRSVSSFFLGDTSICLAFL